jgi:glycine/D-amino acid oxidase-like deaminating enzyme
VDAIGCDVAVIGAGIAGVSAAAELVAEARVVLLETDGFFRLAGQGGTGVNTAPVLARATAGLILRGRLPQDLPASDIRPHDLSPRRGARPRQHQGELP